MRTIVSALTFAAISILISSCVTDKEIDNPAPGTNDDAQLVLRLTTPQGYSTATRSLTYADENTIGDIWVLVFDKNNTLAAIKKGDNVTSSEGNTNPLYSGEGSFSVTLSPSGTPADTYNLVVLANAQAIISGTIGFDVAAITDKSYASVMAEISAAITGPMYPSGGTIPMWGESGQLVVKSGSNNHTLQLTRSVARIDVGVGKATKEGSMDAWSWDGKDASDATIPFRLGHVYVIKPNNRYAVAPGKTKLAAGEPTVPAGTLPFTYADSESNFGFTATASATGGHTSRDIYVPEADIEMGFPASSGDANHTNRMAIVVGGYYNGNTTETFYRLDFAVGGSLVNVLRNHLYQFNISKVSGDGFPDVETAYNSLSMNMTVDIYEWDETDMGQVVFDGQNYLSVSPDEFNFSREAITGKEENNVLYVKTDYATTLGGQQSGWYVEKIVDAADGTTLVTWVTLTSDGTTPITGGGAGIKTEVVLTVPENDTQPRSAIIWIAAGRMRYPVTVNQSLAPALSLRVTNGGGDSITDMLFISALGTQPEPQTLTVNWQPVDADLTITNTSFGTNAFLPSSGAPASQTISDGSGTVSYTIQPPATAKVEVTINPFLEKISKIDFAVSDGSSKMEASIFLRQISYNLVTDVAADYILGSQQETIHVRANFGWEITGVTDTDDILNGESALIGLTGGNNTTTGDEVHFTMEAATPDGSKEGKTATITFESLVDNSEWTVTITATEPKYVGHFAGELLKTDGVWQFTKPLYVQSMDEGTGTWGLSDETESTSDWDGRQNTWNLRTETFPAAYLCYNKNSGASTAADMTWYLPAQKQLMAVWVLNESFTAANKLSQARYWSATEEDVNFSWHVGFFQGFTGGYSKTTTGPVRCVREL